MGPYSTVSYSTVCVSYSWLLSLSMIIAVGQILYLPRTGKHHSSVTILSPLGRAYMRDLTFYLANTPPLPGPHVDVDIGILQTATEAGSTPICLHFSCPPETRWSRSTDRGWPQRRQWRFPSTLRVFPFNVL